MFAIPALTAASWIERNATLRTWLSITLRQVWLEATTKIKDGASFLKCANFNAPQTNFTFVNYFAVNKAWRTFAIHKSVRQPVPYTSPRREHSFHHAEKALDHLPALTRC